MKKLIALAFLIIIIVQASSAQTETVKPGSIKYLDYKNGFKEIKLGTDISLLKDRVKFESSDKDSSALYTYDLKADTLISGVKVAGVIINTFNGRIMKIIVYLDKDWGHKLWEVFYEAYGVMTSRPNQFMNKFLWVGKTVELMFDFESRQPTADYTDRKIYKEYLKFSKENSQKAVKEL